MNMNQQHQKQLNSQFMASNPHLQQLFNHKQLGSIFSIGGGSHRTPSSSNDTPGQQLVTAGFESGGWSSGEELSRHLVAGSSNQTQQSQLASIGGTGTFNSNNTVYQSPFFQHQSQHPQYQTNSSEIERMFHKAYFDQVLKMQDQQQAQGGLGPLFAQYASLGHQDFASNEEELSSIEASSPVKEIQIDDRLMMIHPKNPSKRGDDIDKQIRQIMRVIGKLNQQEDAHDEILVEQDQQAPRAPPNATLTRDSNRNSAKDIRSLRPQESQKEISRNEKSPLQKFLTINPASVSSGNLIQQQKVPQNIPLGGRKSLLRPKSPINHIRPNLNQSPRFLNTPTTQQKIYSAIQTLSSLSITASGGKLKQNLNEKSPLSQKSGDGDHPRSSSRGGSRSRSGKLGSKRKAGKDEFLNQDMISRLFINHQRQLEVRDQKKYIQLQKEVEDVKDRPTISPRSRDIALSSDRFHLPIYNKMRYQKEIQTYLSRKEESKRLKYLQEKQQELYEDQEMQVFSKSHSTAKLTPTDFLRKYNNQVRVWENRVRSGSGRQGLRKGSKSASQTRLDQNDEEQTSFQPKINPRSKQLAKDIERIENRVNKLQEDKQRKLDHRQMLEQPSFHPIINPVSEMIATENRRSQVSGRQSASRQSQSPLLKKYLSSMRELSDWKHSNSDVGLTDKSPSRKSLGATQLSLQSRLKDISAPSSKLSKNFKMSKSSSNINRKDCKFQKLLNPVQLSKQRNIKQQQVPQQVISNAQSVDFNGQHIASKSFLNVPILANLTQVLPHTALNLMLTTSESQDPSAPTDSYKGGGGYLSFQAEQQYPRNEEEVLYDYPSAAPQIEPPQQIIKQDEALVPSNQLENDQQEDDTYIQGILSNTQNLEAYLQQYLVMQSVNTQASSDGEVASVSVQQPSPALQVDIFHEYMKIKKEMDEQINNRHQQQHHIVSRQNEATREGDQVRQEVRESQSTMVVQEHTSFVQEHGDKEEITQSEKMMSNTNRSEIELMANEEMLDNQYALEFAGTLGQDPQLPMTNQGYLTLDQHHLTSSNEFQNSQYQTSPTNQVLYTANSSCDTIEAADQKNLQVLHLQSMSDATLQGCCPGAPGSHFQHLVGKSLRDSLFKDHVPSKELQEAETILANIRQSLQSLNDSPSSSSPFDLRDSNLLPFALKVDEMERESSSDGSSDEFVQRARQNSFTAMVNRQKSSNSRDRIEKKWSNAVELNQIKSSSKEYKKIVAKRKGGTKVITKKNQTEQMEQQDSANSQLKKQAQKGAQQSGHRKSPTHAQILHRIPLDQQSAKLMQMKSIGSLCSNPSSGSNVEQIAEETKQEHSQALTYQSGGFMKEFAPEDYSLNTWNSPTKGATTTSASQTMNQNYNNLRQYDSAYRAYLFQQLSDQKMSELALYVDQETKQMIENSRITLLQTIEKDQYFFPQSESIIFKNDSGKQEEIVKKLVLSNKKQFNPFQYEAPTSKVGPLNIPPDVYQEIEEFGLDTLTIIQSVIREFQDVFDQSKKQPRMKLRQQMKSAEQKYHSSMFVTFNKSKPQ